jgi:Ca2+-binding EF-hand superfamily protein
MKARLLPLGLLSAALCAIPALAQTETKPDAAKADRSGQMEKRRQEMLKRFDQNGDGKLDDEEKAAMKEAMKQERGPRGSGDIGSLGGPGQPDDPAGRMDRFRQEMLKRFDKNGDGKLDEAEQAEADKARAEFIQKRGGPEAARMREEMIKRFDRDGDGKLDADELADLEAARQQMQQLGGAGRFREQMMKMFDKNGDGVLDEAERAEAAKFREEQVRRFDKNGDGKLDPEERAEALKAFMTEHPEMAPPPGQ